MMGRIYEFVCDIDLCYTSISQKSCPARNLTKTCPKGSAHNIAEHFWVRGRLEKKCVPRNLTKTFPRRSALSIAKPFWIQGGSFRKHLGYFDGLG